ETEALAEDAVAVPVLPGALPHDDELSRRERGDGGVLLHPRRIRVDADLSARHVPRADVVVAAAAVFRPRDEEAARVRAGADALDEAAARRRVQVDLEVGGEG